MKIESILVSVFITLLILISSCATSMHGYTGSAALNQFLKVDENNNSVGFKRLLYIIDYRGELIRKFIEEKGYPEYIYEYKTNDENVNESERFVLYYLNEGKAYDYMPKDLDSDLGRLFTFRAFTESEKKYFKDTHAIPNNLLSLVNSLPDKLWELNKKEIIIYEIESPGGGLGVDYSGPCCAVDLYLYDAEIASIPDNINDDIVVNLFKQTMNIIINVYSKDEFMNLVHSDGILKEIGNKKTWFMEMEFASKGIEKYSVLGMTVFEGKFFKFRITTPKSELNAHKYRVKKIIESIGDHFFTNKPEAVEKSPVI